MSAHPPEEVLLAVASGQADLAYRVLVEGHLDACSSCRAVMAEISAPGGALLADLPAVPPPPELWERLRSRIAALPPEGTPPSPALAGLPLPEAVLRELPEVGPLRWRRLPASPALWAVLHRDPGTGSVLILGHMPPGEPFPAHVHAGPEDVLVLAGGYEDHLGAFEAGAYGSYAHGSRHAPRTEPGEECWTLTRLEHPVRFLGWRGWLQRLRVQDSLRQS